jgi:pimeloyl-ACP methyl ester carboxylesterase
MSRRFLNLVATAASMAALIAVTIPTVFGYSMGAATGLRLAIDHPE